MESGGCLDEGVFQSEREELTVVAHPMAVFPIVGSTGWHGPP